MSKWLFAFLALTLGIVVEDVTYKFSDNRRLPAPAVYNSFVDRVPVAAQLGLARIGNLGDLRNDEMFDKTGNVSALGAELAERKAFSTLCGPKAAALEAAMKDLQRVQTVNGERDFLERCGQRVYYQAKNIAYRQATYYDELTHLERRIDFARSCSLVAFVLAALSLVVWLPFAVYRAWKEEAWRTFARITVQLVQLVLVLFAIHLVTVCAYVREESEFNKRVLGYYSTSLAPDVSQSPAGSLSQKP